VLRGNLGTDNDYGDSYRIEVVVPYNPNCQQLFVTVLSPPVDKFYHQTSCIRMFSMDSFISGIAKRAPHSIVYYIRCSRCHVLYIYHMQLLGVVIQRNIGDHWMLKREIRLLQSPFQVGNVL
jgi:hypothetical protein